MGTIITWEHDIKAAHKRTHAQYAGFGSLIKRDIDDADVKRWIETNR